MKGRGRLVPAVLLLIFVGMGRPHPCYKWVAVKPQHLKELIDAKRQWSEPLGAEEIAKGFKGWYSSKYLPHFDAPGTQQFVPVRPLHAARQPSPLSL